MNVSIYILYRGDLVAQCLTYSLTFSVAGLRVGLRDDIVSAAD